MIAKEQCQIHNDSDHRRSNGRQWRREFQIIVRTLYKGPARQNKNKRWQKVKIINGVSEGACEDGDQPYEYIQSSPLIGKYRVKHYGDKKFSTTYLNLKVERKDSI